MGKNLEIKIGIDNIEHKIKLAESVGAQMKEVLHQKDVYYRNDKGLLKLRIENDDNQLILYNRNEDGSERWSDYKIVYMGSNAEDFLDTVFEREKVVEKTRILYMYKDTRIHFDKVVGLGDFLELEAVCKDSEKEAKAQFDFLIEKLNLNVNEQILMSYSQMV